MHYTLRDILVHKPISTPPRLIKVPVSSHENERSCVCVLDVSSMPLYTVFFLYKIFRTLSRAWLFHVLLHFLLNIYITGLSHKRLLFQFIFKYFVRKKEMKMFKIIYLYLYNIFVFPQNLEIVNCFVCSNFVIYNVCHSLLLLFILCVMYVLY